MLRTHISFCRKMARLTMTCKWSSLICVLLVLCFAGCPPTERVRSKSPNELYSESLKKSTQGNYEQAYYDYQKAVEMVTGMVAVVVDQVEAEDQVAVAE